MAGRKQPHYHGLDLGYRIGYRIRWFLSHIFGPPQTTPESDPVKRLERQREERYARRAKKVTARRRARWRSRGSEAAARRQLIHLRECGGRPGPRHVLGPGSRRSELEPVDEKLEPAGFPVSRAVAGIPAALIQPANGVHVRLGREDHRRINATVALAGIASTAGSELLADLDDDTMRKHLIETGRRILSLHAPRTQPAGG